MAMSENRSRALRGELYFAFTPELVKARRRCEVACQKYNSTEFKNRREQVLMMMNVLDDSTAVPGEKADEADDSAQFDEYPWIEAPFRADYGTNISLGKNVYINFNCTILDTCKVSIGDRTMLASNVSIYSATHPLDPSVRNGTQGPEYGREIHIEEDCWIGGNAILCPGVTIGRGSVVGAGSVVTKSVPPYTVVAGNPAKKIKDVPLGTDEARTSGAIDALQRDIMRQ